MEKKLPVLHIVAVIGALLISLLFVYPFFWMAANSFKTTREILSNTLSLIPASPNFNAYREITDLGGLTLNEAVINSLYIVGMSVLICVAVTSLGAYALTRRPELKLFGLVEKFFLISIMYPYIMLTMPVYVVMYKLGLLGTYTGIILYLSVGPIQFFLFREFFKKVPYSVIESAQIDGASELRIFSNIMFPMAKPVFLTAVLLTFILNWDNWFPILVISTRMSTYTLPVALFSLDSQLEVNFPEIMALSTVVSLPVMLVFLFTQRQVMDGFAAGSVKG